MIITCGGKGSADFAHHLDSAGVEYEILRPTPGVVVAAVGDILNIAEHATPYDALAGVLIGWLKMRASRDVILSTKAHRVFHARGYSVEEVGRLLRATSRITVIDPEPLEDKQHS